MTKKLSLFILLLTSCISFSQINYEKGYVLDNYGKRIECYIKNVDWKNNPTSIDYKLNLDSNPLVGNLKDVSEFGVDNFSKFVRADVGVDRSSIDLDNFDHIRIPNLKRETLFLKVLKEANVTLYAYEEGNLNLYFLKSNTGKIEQLIYKPYKLDNQRVNFYSYFRQQLLNVMDCKDMKSEIEKTHYNKVELENIFQKYYECSAQTGTEINTNKPKTKFSLTIKPGITMRSFAFKRPNYPEANVDFGTKTFGRIGVELEALLPFNKGKWALFIEPYYDYYNYSKTIPTYGDVKAKSTAVNLPCGVRHYMFLNNNSRLFLNLAYNLNIFSSDSTASYQFAQTDITIETGSSITVGLGFKYNKYSAEVRTDIGSTTATNYSDLQIKTAPISFIFGYTIF